MMGSTIPFGAEQRLLPEWIPLSFFAFALLCLPLGWVLVVVQSGNISDFSGGFGPVLAALHTFTIGVIMTTAFGASLQMLPVASATTMANPKRTVMVLALHLTGSVIILGGFSHYLSSLSAIAASLIFCAALIYIYLIGSILLKAKEMAQVRMHGVIGAACLLIALALALLMILDWAGYLTLLMPNTVRLHGGFALFGFMGFLVLGFSRIMIPMLAISDANNDKLATLTFGFGILGLILWAFNHPIAALTFALIAAFLHIYEMGHILKARLMKRLGPEWYAIGFSWIMLPSSLGGLLYAHLFETQISLMQIGVVLGVLGWLVSFIIGILQRIIPFLLSMQIARKTGIPELPSKLSHEKLLKAVVGLHIPAVLGLALGLLIKSPALIAVGAIMGSTGGILFLSFFIIALKRKTQSLERMTS